MKVKTADLIGPALDWAVAQCEGLNPNSDPKVRRQYVGYSGFAEAAGFGYAIKHYSTDWSQGGAIIERESVELLKGNPILFVDGTREDLWIAKHQSVADRRPNGVHGPTPLIAAMRCFVASRLGDEVDVPEELL